MKILLLTIGLSLTFSVSASEYKCKEHGYFLKLEEGGFEHVNHHLLLSGDVLIKELEEAMWFIEGVSCTINGFEIIASHAQYNDPTKRKFTLKIINKNQYEIK